MNVTGDRYALVWLQNFIRGPSATVSIDIIEDAVRVITLRPSPTSVRQAPLCPVIRSAALLHWQLLYGVTETSVHQGGLELGDQVCHRPQEPKYIVVLAL